MCIEISGSDIVDKHESMLIHFFHHVLDFDYRTGLFTDESSLYDMGSQGFEKEDYIKVAESYFALDTSSFDYFEGKKVYYKILHEYWDNLIYGRIENVYGISLDRSTNLLKDICLIFDEKLPLKDWNKENIFVLKTLDNKAEREKLEIDKLQAEMAKHSTNVIELKIKKKLTQEEILASTNDFLISKELGISFEEAQTIARNNYSKKMEGKKFDPYIPE